MWTRGSARVALLHLPHESDPQFSLGFQIGRAIELTTIRNFPHCRLLLVLVLLRAQSLMDIEWCFPRTGPTKNEVHWKLEILPNKIKNWNKINHMQDAKNIDFT